MADNVSPLASFSLTHVYYDPSDPISYLCAFLALVPQALCVVYATLIWSTREAEVALMFAGQLACEAANFALKRLIKEERPKRIHGKGYGMPSSHAQFAFFWAVAVALFLVVRHRPRPRQGAARSGGAAANETPVGGGGGAGGSGSRSMNKGGIAGSGPATSAPGSTAAFRGGALGPLTAWDVERYAHQPWSLLERVAASAVALVLAAMVAWSRVYLNYHTPKQVLAGCLAGAVSAVAWFAATYVMRQTGLLALALDMPVARWFRLRDLVTEEDLCQAGWEKWEDRKLRALQAKSK